MKIAVIGAGAMGSIYGGRLSLHNEVRIVDTNQDVVDRINDQGLVIDENGVSNTYHPRAMTTTEGEEPAELVILFVKSIFSKVALEGNRSLIDSKTRLMTLQNGAGHEELLAEFVSEDRIIIGTTEDNGVVLEPGRVRRGGEGRTNLGMLVEDGDGFLNQVKEAFDQCGFCVFLQDDIRRLIWSKLFTNVSLSAVTGILQVDMGYIASNEYAWALTRQLIHEAVLTAKASGLEFDEEEITEKVRQTSEKNPKGCTSIRADLRDGRRTEVDTISGSVVRTAARYGVSVPGHEFVVNMVHAMEGRK